MTTRTILYADEGIFLSKEGRRAESTAASGRIRQRRAADEGSFVLLFLHVYEQSPSEG